MGVRSGSRILLGAIFLVAGLSKAHQPEIFAAQIAGYQLVPSTLVTLMALALPRIEILAGMGLIFRLLPRSCALVTAALSLGFAISTSVALARGLNIDCGCLPVELKITWLHPLVDLALLALSVRVVQERADSSRK